LAAASGKKRQPDRAPAAPSSTETAQAPRRLSTARRDRGLDDFDSRWLLPALGHDDSGPVQSRDQPRTTVWSEERPRTVGSRPSTKMSGCETGRTALSPGYTNAGAATEGAALTARFRGGFPGSRSRDGMPPTFLFLIRQAKSSKLSGIRTHLHRTSRNHPCPFGYRSAHDPGQEIDAIRQSPSSSRLPDLADLGRAPPRVCTAFKYVEGDWMRRMAWRPAWEDRSRLPRTRPAGLFASAGADPSKSDCAWSGRRPRSITRKPIAAWLHRLVGLPQRVRSTRQSTPVSAAPLDCWRRWTGLLPVPREGARPWWSATDIARYPLRSAGEPTQGAGAVALLVPPRPRLLTLEPGVSGSYTSEVMTSAPPLQQGRVVDGHHSVDCLSRRACGPPTVRGRKRPPPPTCTAISRAHLSRALRPRLARKAHRHSRMLDGLGDEAEADLRRRGGGATSLRFQPKWGNVYTGSLYCALRFSLASRGGGDSRAGRIGLFSYGSGCVANPSPAGGGRERPPARSPPTPARCAAHRSSRCTVGGIRGPSAPSIPPRTRGRGRAPGARRRGRFAGVDGDRRVYVG